MFHDSWDPTTAKQHEQRRYCISGSSQEDPTLMLLLRGSERDGGPHPICPDS